VIFVITFLIDGATRPGYDPWRNFVSQLSTGERGWLQIANFVVCGTLFLAGAGGLWRVRAPHAIAVIIGVLGLSLIIAGIFVTDPGLGYPPGERVLPRPTLHDTIHRLVSLPAFLALGIAPIAAALQIRSARAWTVYSLLSGIVSLAFFAAMVAAAAQEERVVSGTAIGLLQRVSIIAAFVWFSAFFARLRRVNGG
jgi:hypothetical membrane protein